MTNHHQRFSSGKGRALSPLTSSHNHSGVWGCRALCGKSPTATGSAIGGPSLNALLSGSGIAGVGGDGSAPLSDAREDRVLRSNTEGRFAAKAKGPTPAIPEPCGKRVLAAVLLTLLRESDARLLARRRLAARDLVGCSLWQAVGDMWACRRAALLELAL